MTDTKQEDARKSEECSYVLGEVVFFHSHSISWLGNCQRWQPKIALTPQLVKTGFCESGKDCVSTFSGGQHINIQYLQESKDVKNSKRKDVKNGKIANCKNGQIDLDYCKPVISSLLHINSFGMSWSYVWAYQFLQQYIGSRDFFVEEVINYY